MAKITPANTSITFPAIVSKFERLRPVETTLKRLNPKVNDPDMNFLPWRMPPHRVELMVSSVSKNWSELHVIGTTASTP